MERQLRLPGFVGQPIEDRYVCSCGNSLFTIREDHIECVCGLRYEDSALPVGEFNATRDNLLLEGDSK